MTGIEWTQQVWNPTTGCDKVSPGCGLPRFEGDDTGGCYAMAMAKRLKGMGKGKYQNDGDPRTSGPGFGITEHPDALNIPLRWRTSRKVFVNSMSDLFHTGVSDEFIARVFAVMAATPQHTYQVLTKRHGRMRSLIQTDPQNLLEHLTDEREAGWLYDAPWPLPNVWLGVSAEDQKRADLRIPALLDTPAAVRFVSAEPLLGPIDLHGPVDAQGHRTRLTYWLTGQPGWGPEVTLSSGLAMQTATVGPRLDWLIVGGESGPSSRPMDLDWAWSLVKQCQDSGVAVFVKQVGSVWAREHGADSKGGDPSYWPADLRVREFPKVVTA